MRMINRALGLCALVVTLTLACYQAASAADADQLVRLGRFHAPLAGAELWRALYPVPEREPLLAGG